MWGKAGSRAKVIMLMNDEQKEEPGPLERPSPQGRHLVPPRVGWKVPAEHCSQLFPDVEGIIPAGHSRQKGEAAAANVPIGHVVQPDEGRPLKPRTIIERTMARSLDACENMSGDDVTNCGGLWSEVPAKNNLFERC
jgi:hypothetical protein